MDDFVIVGAGPAGIFCALELLKQGYKKITIIDRGKEVFKRRCPRRENNTECAACKICDITSGFGGSGAWSDGKITKDVTGTVGGWMSDFLTLDELAELTEYVDQNILTFSNGGDRYFSPDPEFAEKMDSKCRKENMRLITYPIRHLGTDNAAAIMDNIYKFLKDKINIVLKTKVDKILVEDGKAVGVSTTNGDVYKAKKIVMGVGRGGTNWLKSECDRLGISYSNNAVDIGVRVETLKEYCDEFTDNLYEFKIEFVTQTYEDSVRTFCVCPEGYVTTERYDETTCVNGESRTDIKSPNTNFAILVTCNFTEPFKQPIQYAKHVANLANMLSGGNSVLIQRFEDLKNGRRSTPERLSRSVIKPTLESAVAGDISFAMPSRVMSDLRDFLTHLNGIMPGIDGPNTLFYAPEIKLYSIRIDLTNDLESKDVKNIYFVGDGAGITRGVMHSAISGIVVARANKK
ncbi:MAG: NAD(P)/FAD-dependent oxidoreductase [Candidatus Heimdallarchaeota archaeon]|nr:NAD(P)/FAD-dependent oxidoreductase [Candidatus Heimdallarchaeota archaeon]MBY8993470.1 NAD(P)/FAD-dependent oxidoreductase [Candidatus Heimdallarchaeota archaeon]